MGRSGWGVTERGPWYFRDSCRPRLSKMGAGYQCDQSTGGLGCLAWSTNGLVSGVGKKTTALGLYKKLGFSELYRTWYRTKTNRCCRPNRFWLARWWLRHVMIPSVWNTSTTSPFSPYLRSFPIRGRSVNWFSLASTNG